MILNRQERFPVLRRRGDVLLVAVATFGLMVVTAEFQPAAADPAAVPQIEIYAVDADGTNARKVAAIPVMRGMMRDWRAALCGTT